MTLLESYGVEVEGKKAVVVGASNIVGRPQMLELLLSRATVTICHSKTRNLAEEVASADSVVAGVFRRPHGAAGRRHGGHRSRCP
ncbi:MAG: hypothetical protein ACFNLH_02960, partial [Corynebacterium matruchotii]